MYQYSVVLQIMKEQPYAYNQKVRWKNKSYALLILINNYNKWLVNQAIFHIIQISNLQDNTQQLVMVLNIVLLKQNNLMIMIMIYGHLILKWIIYNKQDAKIVQLNSISKL